VSLRVFVRRSAAEMGSEQFVAEWQCGRLNISATSGNQPKTFLSI
jgi:hypothetical protein